MSLGFLPSCHYLCSRQSPGPVLTWKRLWRLQKRGADQNPCSLAGTSGTLWPCPGSWLASDPPEPWVTFCGLLCPPIVGVLGNWGIPSTSRRRQVWLGALSLVFPLPALLVMGWMLTPQKTCPHPNPRNLQMWFGKRGFANIIKLRVSRWDHPELSRWALNPMTSAL